MRSGYACSLLAAAILSAAALAGCGDGAEADSESYGTLLIGLKRAALAGKPFHAVERAEDLKPVLRASIDAFCETNQQMLLNNEAWKAKDTGYYIVRLKLRAERELPFISSGPVGKAVDRYRALYGLDDFDPAGVRRYTKACYH